MSLTVSEHSARHLRLILRSYLTSWGMDPLADPAALALTELVANVVRHVPDRRCTVLIQRRKQGVRVEVADGNADLPPEEPPYPDGLAEGGRGLLLVDAVTDRWEVRPLPGGNGKTIWFECDRDHDT
ncbi:ATP-binding protein [Actinomycetota bacterium Odt1-20B]